MEATSEASIAPVLNGKYCVPVIVPSAFDISSYIGKWIVAGKERSGSPPDKRSNNPTII